MRLTSGSRQGLGSSMLTPSWHPVLSHWSHLVTPAVFRGIVGLSVTNRVWSEAWQHGLQRDKVVGKADSYLSITALQWEDCETVEIHPRSLQRCLAKAAFAGLEVRLPLWASIQGHSIGGCCRHCTLQESRNLSSTAHSAIFRIQSRWLGTKYWDSFVMKNR